MAIQKQYKWIIEEELHDGHRIFRDNQAEVRWAIADASGDTPEQTDDGVLWLDVTKPLVLSGYPMIPLKNDAGQQTRTITDGPTLLWLSARFDWMIHDEAHNLYYTVRDYEGE